MLGELDKDLFRTPGVRAAFMMVFEFETNGIFYAAKARQFGRVSRLLNAHRRETLMTVKFEWPSQFSIKTSKER